jgi:valyl-tRNA synthetase
VLYKFNEAAGAAYRFVWNVFCDWYLELAKPVLQGADGAAKDETRASVAFVLDQICKLLHPFMPFLTEELWQLTAENGPARAGLLTLSSWPQLPTPAGNDAEAEIGWVIDLVTAIRSVRSEMMIPAGTAIPLVLVGVAAETDARVGRWAEVIKRLARLSSIAVSMSVPEGAVQLLVRGDTVALPLKGIVDFSAEQARLEKEISRAAADIARIDTKLNNPNFVSRAAEEVVEQERERREEAEARRLKIIEALERLKGVA